MRNRKHRVSAMVEALEGRNLLSNSGFGAANAAMAQGGYAGFINPQTGQPYANYGQLHAQFAQGNGIIAGNTGLGDYNSSNPNDPGISKVADGTLPPGQT